MDDPLGLPRRPEVCRKRRSICRTASLPPVADAVIAPTVRESHENQPIAFARQAQSYWSVAFALLPLLAAATAEGGVIFVTTLEQKIKDKDDPTSIGCSLQEAIFSANRDEAIAIASYYSSGVPKEVATSCVPGSGDDVIVLPPGGVFLLKRIVDDAINPFGPTATPIITSNITIEGFGATLYGVPNFHPINQQFFRAFAVGATGKLTLRSVYVRGFRSSRWQRRRHFCRRVRRV